MPLLELGKSCAAWSAPMRPEIKQDYFPAQSRQIRRGLIEPFISFDLRRDVHRRSRIIEREEIAGIRIDLDHAAQRQLVQVAGRKRERERAQLSRDSQRVSLSVQLHIDF